MTTPIDEQRKNAALDPPPARPRAQRRGQQPPPPAPAAAVPTPPRVDPAVASAAKLRLAQRTAGQAFLPVLSKLGKLRDVVAECELAVTDALAAGVDPDSLQRELEYFADKAGVEWGWVPDAIRDALSGGPAAPQADERQETGG